MEAIFLQLTTSTALDIILRFILLPSITMICYYLFLMFFIRVKLLKNEIILDNFYLNFQFSRIYAINTSILVLNGYWYYLLHNNWHIMDWGFVFNITNIYLQLAPFIIANVLLILLYTRTRQSISNII